MAFVYQPAVFKEIANSMGLADKNLQDQLESTIVGSGVSQLISSRNRIAACIGDTTISSIDFDGSTVLGQVFRSKEVGISLHLDGARIWNAHIATGTPLLEYGKYFEFPSSKQKL